MGIINDEQAEMLSGQRSQKEIGVNSKSDADPIKAGRYICFAAMDWQSLSVRIKFMTFLLLILADEMASHPYAPDLRMTGDVNSNCN